MFSLNVIRVFSKKKGKPQFSLKIQIKQNNKLNVGHSNYLISLSRSSEKKTAYLVEPPSWRNGPVNFIKIGKVPIEHPN